MMDIIQIFKSVQRFGKKDYAIAKPTLLTQWEKSIESQTGYLENGILYLPDTGSQPQDIQNAQTLVLQDMRGFDPFLFPIRAVKTYQPRWLIESIQPHWYKDYHKNNALSVNCKPICFYRLAAYVSLEVFKIQKNKDESFDLYLDYETSRGEIGIPKRDNHKIAELKLNQPIRYRLNGKSDYKQRTFSEYDYIIEYTGRAEKVVFKDWDKIRITKSVADKEYKLIDERKILR